MIKHLLSVCLLAALFTGLKAQPYGNEWIDYTQEYYKIKIAQNGVYRIDYNTLAAAGIPVNSVDPRNFQLFNKGVQQSIFVEGENDGIFNTTDFIEFYAQQNDGALDSLLYKNTFFVPNPYYSLVSDTAVYFFTWNHAPNNKRMIPETDTAFSSYAPSVNYFFKEEIHSFHSDYFAGETDDAGNTDSRYTRSEGWFDGSVIYLGGNQAYTNLVNTSNAYSAGPDATIKTVVIGASRENPGAPDHHLVIEYRGQGGYQVFVDTLFKGYEANRFVYSLPAASLGTNFTDFNFSSVTNPGFSSNRTTVSYISVKYPHTFDLEGKSAFLIYLPDNTSQSKSYLNISNFNASGTVRMYDLSNHKRIDVIQVGNTYQALIPNSGYEKKCFITSEGSIVNVSALQAVTPSGLFTNFSTFATDSAFIIVTHKSLMASAINYKTYRSTAYYGGGHNVVLADIGELYDQFAYGIVKSPLAVKGFSDYLLDTYPTQPQNLFLVGKSIHLALCRQNNVNYANCLVPSFGNPSSDNLLTAGLNGTILEPAIPTGRLSAATNNDVDLYLNKVRDYENRTTNPPAEWMKEVLHFGGGSTSFEQNSFKVFLNKYKDTIQNIFYGGHVTEFFKTTSAPIQINTSTVLTNLINNGVSLMTFFGHASGTGFDQSIDDVHSYNPLPGHYPFLLANSCYAGDFHQPGGSSSSETFVLVAQKGMIGYLGSVGLGMPYALDRYSEQFYRELSRANYGKSVGSTIKKVIHTIQPQALNDTLLRSTCFDMSLQGDPSLKINTHDKPDYKIVNSDVYFDLTSQVDSVTVFAVRTNLGKATNDSIFTELIRTFPNGETVTYLLRNKGPKFKDTVSFKLYIDYDRGIGLNKIKITLDRNLEVDELNENNNSTNPDVDLLISGGDIVPVYPYRFAIIPKDTITLKASTANAFAPAKNYKFQIDTTDTFNSPFLQTTIINSPGGVVKWKPSLVFTDSTVYYWRTSPDSINPSSGYRWHESSFQYITTKHGWEQAHFFQFKNDTFEYVKFNRPQRKFDFVNDIKTISCKNGTPSSAILYSEVAYKINGTVQYVSSWARPGMTIAVFDPVSGYPIHSIANGAGHGQFGNITNGYAGAVENAFDFKQDDSASRAVMANFINNDIPYGYYVLAYSQDYHSIPQYESSVDSAFQTVGSTNIQNVPAGRPYILWGRKGFPGTAKEIIGSSASSIIQLDTTINTKWTVGTISSPVIGPSTKWKSFHWRERSLDGASSNDSIHIRLIGIKANGTETVLYNFPKDSIDVLDLGNYANAQVYPNIRLAAVMKDDTLHTPPQMKRWQIIYDPVPEAALNPPLGFSFPNNSVEEGDNISIRIPIQNISDIPFTDSLLVTYWLEDVNRVNHPLPDKVKKKPFIPNEVIMDTIGLNTAAYGGNNALWIEVNPVNHLKSQLEQYHFNNIVRIPFTVNADKINPLLDVTFDGVHILNNDIVSAKPNILMKLKDENQFLALNDTNDFKIFIQTPSLPLKRIYFGQTMTFIPAVLPNNSCRINYTPILSEDGTYQLVVQAKDKSYNLSGALDYKINFEIVNKSSITEVMNYPNPFSTATHFVFTLTGSSIPENFKIQIMTITGKVVREIFQDEIGLVHIGRNITDYAWDGKDEFGDRLANGVYLYRVITKLNGEDIEKRHTDADQYFKKGWGKMYLIR